MKQSFIARALPYLNIKQNTPPEHVLRRDVLNVDFGSFSLVSASAGTHSRRSDRGGKSSAFSSNEINACAVF